MGQSNMQRERSKIMRRSMWPPKRQPGQSLVEFALISPILLFMLLGVIDTGLLLATKNTVAYACRQGARLMEAYGAGNSASSNPDPSILQAMVDALRSSGTSLKGLKSITFYYAPQTGIAQQGDNNTAHIVYTYNVMTNSWTPLAGVGSFTASTRSSGQYVGITMQYTYTGFTPLYGGGVTFNEVTNTQLDPQGGAYVVPTPAPAPTRIPPTPPPAYTPNPTNTPAPFYTPQPTYTPGATHTPVPTTTATPTTIPTTTATPTTVPTTTATPTTTPTGAATAKATATTTPTSTPIPTTTATSTPTTAASTATPTPQTVDDTTSGTGTNQFTYQGSHWTHCTNCSNYATDASFSYNGTAGESVSMSFNGTGITLFSAKSPSGGYGTVSIDGVPKAPNIDYYASTTQLNQQMYTINNLSKSIHTFKLQVTGQCDSANNTNNCAVAQFIGVDHVVITP